MFILAVAISFVLAVAGSRLLIPLLKRAKFGQEVREEGPESHLKKQGTPTMGGVVFFLAMGIPLLLFGSANRAEIGFLVASAFGFGLIGFLDDGLKIFMKRSLGLTAKQKLSLQLIVSIVLSFWAICGFKLSTGVWLPLFNVVLPLGILYIPVMIFVMLGTTNACNLTDGLDGLLSSVTIPVYLGFLAIGAVSHEASVFLFAAVGCVTLIGFLFYNRYPAQVFMGDTGSFFIGGSIVGLAVLTKTEFLLPLIGFVYVAEACSVILQVVVYKRKKKRILRMAPLHHHFELGGWREPQVVLRFALLSAVCVVVAMVLYSTVEPTLFASLTGGATWQHIGF